MPRGAHLTNVASNLCGSFASRNNDLDGYWAIGKLRSLAERNGQTTVLLDLLASSTQPSSSELAPVLAHYRGLLAKLTDLSHVPFEEITSAHITLVEESNCVTGFNACFPLDRSRKVTHLPARPRKQLCQLIASERKSVNSQL